MPDRNALLEDNLSLVQAVAHRSFHPLCRDQDLLQCGRIALWQASLHWDGNRPFRPYACACIHNAMTRWATRLGRWSALPPEEYDLDTPSPEGRIVDDLAFRTRIEAVWPPGSEEHLVLTSLADGVPKEALAARLGRSTWSLTRFSRRAWQRVASAQ